MLVKHEFSAKKTDARVSASEWRIFIACARYVAKTTTKKWSKKKTLTSCCPLCSQNALQQQLKTSRGVIIFHFNFKSKTRTSSTIDRKCLALHSPYYNVIMNLIFCSESQRLLVFWLATRRACSRRMKTKQREKI